MANLFWKSKQATKALLSTPFKSEEEFESLVFDTPEFLEDIFLLKRQVRGGNKPGIPDIVGIDNDGSVCIIEMKNVEVDAAIIPQVLQYAFWAETNPDSIRSLWLECDDKPDDLPVSWDSLQVRIVVIAPSILRSTLAIVDKINYPVDLIEVKRWVEGENSFLLVNWLEAEPQQKSRPVTGMESYDLEYFRREYNEASATEYFRYIDELEKLVAANGWNLQKKHNKTYCGFKAGFFNAFGIMWIGTKTFALFLKLSEREAKSVGPPMTKYDSNFKQSLYYIDPKKTKLDDYFPLFEMAYNKRAGD